MAVEVYTTFTEIPFTEGVSNGQKDVLINGDKTSEAWCQSGQVLKFKENNLYESKTIDTVSFDDISGKTTITFTVNLTNSYTTEGKMWYLNNRIKPVVGTLVGDDNTTSFTVGATQPTEVRSYKAGTPYGALLELGTDWSYNSGLEAVELSYTPTVGETVIAFGTGTWLFSDAFLAVDFIEENIKDVYLYSDYDYDTLYISTSEKITADLGASGFTIGKEVTVGVWDYYNNQTISDIEQYDVKHIKVKKILDNESAEIKNYYNVTLYISHIQMPTN
jgi:hypothetical protein